MAKYAKNDYRSKKPGNVMTIGPRDYRPRVGFGLKSYVNPNYIPASAPHRHERRAIGAAYRKTYGKSEYLKMKAAIKKHGGLNVAMAMIERMKQDEKAKAKEIQNGRD